MPIAADQPVPFRGNDRLLYGIIPGVITFRLFAGTTVNIAPVMGRDLALGASTMNTAVAITSLFSGIFIVAIGGLADRVGRVRIGRIGFYLTSQALSPLPRRRTPTRPGSGD